MIPKDRIDVCEKWIAHARSCNEGKCHTPLPSIEFDEPYFKHLTYWRGPVWINVIWMIWLGLSKRISQDLNWRQTIEYYDPFTGKGLDGKSFSWAAALVIDMIKVRGIGIPPE